MTPSATGRPGGEPGHEIDVRPIRGLLSMTWRDLLFRLPYYRAETAVRRIDGRVRFRSRRTHGGVPPARFDAEYGPDGPAFTPEPGSLAAFLAENYRFYTVDDGGRIYHGDIDHEPWRLRPARAEIRENTLFEANGFDHPAGEPTLHVADPIRVTAGRVRRT